MKLSLLAGGFVSVLQAVAAPQLVGQLQLVSHLQPQHTAPLLYVLHNRSEQPVADVKVALKLAAGLKLSGLIDGCSQQTLAAGASCSLSGQLSSERAGQYAIEVRAKVQQQVVARVNHQLHVSGSSPQTVYCPHLPPGRLFYVLDQPLPYRVMQDGDDAKAGVRNLILKDQLLFARERWCTSQVSDMHNFFYNERFFNQPIGDWDVSGVTDMDQMFRGATRFDQPIGNWDVSKVTNMHFMFIDAHKFNHAIDNWDVSQVTTMHGMFDRAYLFNQPLRGWHDKTGQVINMSYMFWDASNFKQDLSDWQVEQAPHHFGFSVGSPLPEAFCPHFPTGGRCTQ